MTREELLRRLVAFDSRSQNSNRGIADFICEYVDATARRGMVRRAVGVSP
jgi:hypothetical protein